MSKQPRPAAAGPKRPRAVADGGFGAGPSQEGGNFPAIDLAARVELEELMQENPPEAQKMITDMAKLLSKLHKEKVAQRLVSETTQRNLDTTNSELTARIEELERLLAAANEQRAAMETRVAEGGQQRQEMQRSLNGRDNRIRELTGRLRTTEDRLASQEAGEAERLRAPQEALNRARGMFDDIVTLHLSNCPIPISNGNVMDLDTIIQLLVTPMMQGLHFTGGVDSEFMYPASRTAVRIMDPAIIRFIHSIADGLGIQITVPYAIQYSEHGVQQDPVWRDYTIDQQLRIFLEIVNLHRTRIDENMPHVNVPDTFRTFHTLGNHVFTINRTRRGETNVWDIAFSVFVVRNDGAGAMMGAAHPARMVCNIRFPTRGFVFAGVPDELQPQP